jgi:hypothetical protein
MKSKKLNWTQPKLNPNYQLILSGKKRKDLKSYNLKNQKLMNNHKKNIKNKKVKRNKKNNSLNSLSPIMFKACLKA